jgi:hypothetical protein
MVRILAHLALTENPLRHRFHTVCLVLAAFAALSLITAVAPVANAVSTTAGDAQATRMQQTGSY